MIEKKRRITVSTLLWLSAALWLSVGMTASVAMAESIDSSSARSNGEYRFWRELGSHAALKAMSMMRNQRIAFGDGDFVVISNAGYAEIDGRATMGALDGLGQLLKVGRGDHGLVEVHSAPGAALWFAIYHESSGACVYLQVDPSSVDKVTTARELKRKLVFSIETLETINAQHLFDNAAEYAEKFNRQIFGGNEFRIVTISNAIAVGAPTNFVRAFEFHDHYCPGVTSGVLLASYLNKFYPLASGASYFVHSVQAWCKEDALMVLLNTTPGKSGYAVSYSTAEDRAAWRADVQNASTIVYRKNPQTGLWDGIVVASVFSDTSCPAYGHSVMDKLCADLWYLERADHPERFIQVLHEFTLPAGVEPKSYARAGIDPMKMLGLTQ